MDNTFRIITIREFANILTTIWESDIDTTISFTNDDDLDCVIEPTGWYGITINRMYDERNLIVGYYGGGILYVRNADRIYDDKTTIEDELIALWECVFGETANADTLLCIDEDYERKEEL